MSRHASSAHYHPAHRWIEAKLPRVRRYCPHPVGWHNTVSLGVPGGRLALLSRYLLARPNQAEARSWPTSGVWRAPVAGR
jgi:hypothetical protein